MTAYTECCPDDTDVIKPSEMKKNYKTKNINIDEYGFILYQVGYDGTLQDVGYIEMRNLLMDSTNRALIIVLTEMYPEYCI